MGFVRALSGRPVTHGPLGVLGRFARHGDSLTPRLCTEEGRGARPGGLGEAFAPWDVLTFQPVSSPELDGTATRSQVRGHRGDAVALVEPQENWRAETAALWYGRVEASARPGVQRRTA